MSNKTNSKAYIPTVFQDIETPEELKCYLDDSMRRLDNTPYLHHYTSVSRVVDMIRSGTWHLGNAKGMNDNLEYKMVMLLAGVIYSSVALCVKTKKALVCGVCMHNRGKKV